MGTSKSVVLRLADASSLPETPALRLPVATSLGAALRALEARTVASTA